MKHLLLPLATALTLLAQAPFAQDHAAHMRQMADGTPTLPGDDTFGAITEIVTILQADDTTDWTRVSIDALRLHLRDMDAVARGRAPQTRQIDGGLEMVIDLTGPDGEAASRMVPDHAPVLAAETGWLSVAEVGGQQITWRVTAPTEAAATQIRALGFFGLLATGAHHQAHHLAIARGIGHSH